MTVSQNLARVRDTIGKTCERCGRDGNEVMLVAVCKNVSAEMVAEAAAAGHRYFGENRVQEARDKIPLTPPELTWHMVGTLQKNKAKDAVKLFSWIHSVDSLDLARAIDKRAALAGRKMNVLIEVKLSPENSKFGVLPEDAENLVGEILSMEHLSVRGLMTIPPYSPEPEDSRPYFKKLKIIKEEIGKKLGLADFDQLSMGMSADYDIAIEEGATMVRVGTAIFGPRKEF